MKGLLLIFATLFTLVLSDSASHIEYVQEDDGENMEYFLVEVSPGVYRAEDLVNAEIDARASASDLTYHYFSRYDPSRGVDITIDTVDALGRTKFSPQRRTVFIIHGWVGNNESSVNHRVRESLLSVHDVNIFVADWGPIAGRNYISAMSSVVAVGQHIANFIRRVSERYGLRVSDVALVGFSLGGHIAGNTGAALNGDVDHIVALDPAGPLFTVRNIDNRVDPTDARFVQVIHTNGGLLGFRYPAGDSDYYPNGGSYQAGCGLDIAGGCSHARAYAYYTEAILSRTNLFVSTYCSTYTNYQRGNCRNNHKSVMGGYSVDKSARGDYYLDTNRSSPFGKGG